MSDLLSMMSFPAVSGADIQVSQSPSDLVLKPQASLKIDCTISGVSNPNLFWYRLNHSRVMDLKFFSIGQSMIDPPNEVDGFKASRPVDLQLLLESTSVQLSEPAVWYCAASRHSDTDLSRRRTKTIHGPLFCLVCLSHTITVNCHDCICPPTYF